MYVLCYVNIIIILLLFVTLYEHNFVGVFYQISAWQCVVLGFKWRGFINPFVGRKVKDVSVSTPIAGLHLSIYKTKQTWSLRKNNNRVFVGVLFNTFLVFRTNLHPSIKISKNKTMIQYWCNIFLHGNFYMFWMCTCKEIAYEIYSSNMLFDPRVLGQGW